MLVDRIDALIAKRSPSHWILAAPSAILPRVKNSLHPTSKKGLAEAHPADLTKLTLKQVEARFFNLNAKVA